MLHGPCKDDNLQALCMVRKHAYSLLACLKRFLKPFTDYIMIYKDKYLEYYRRDDS
jgi:hypothetical protein